MQVREAGLTPEHPEGWTPNGEVQGQSKREFEGRFNHLCERPGRRGDQKDALGGQILNFVSSTIPASYTIHMGAPPHLLHTPSMPPRLRVAGTGEWAQY